MAIEITNIAWCFDVEKANAALRGHPSQAELKAASHIDKFVLLVMADCANGPDADGIYPSNAYIAAHAGITTRSVQLAKRRLEALGIITLSQPANQKRADTQGKKYRKTPEYRIDITSVMKFLDAALAQKKRIALLPATHEQDSPVAPEHMHPVHPNRRTGFTGTREQDSPNPLIEPSIKIKLFDRVFLPLPNRNLIPETVADSNRLNADIANKAHHWVFIGDVIKLRDQEFESLRTLSDLSYDALYDVLNQQDRYHASQRRPAHKEDWRRMLLKFFQNYHATDWEDTDAA